MRICRKCSKQASDGSKICRDCGAILEEISDERGAAPSLPPDSPSGSPTAAQSQAADPEVGSGNQAPGDRNLAAWKCPKCGETVPGTFDICWKCRTTREGEKADQPDAGLLQQDSDAQQEEQEIEPTRTPPEGRDDEDEPPRKVCCRCGSAKMMWGVTVCDQGDSSNGSLMVVVLGDPSALIFKDRLYGTLKADICGDCGHVELKVSNPRELYRHYRNANG